MKINKIAIFLVNIKKILFFYITIKWGNSSEEMLEAFVRLMCVGVYFEIILDRK